MDCTTALLKMRQGNLCRRKAWNDGEYLYYNEDTLPKPQIEKVNIKGEPTSEGKGISMEDLGAKDWEVYETICKLSNGELVLQRTVPHVDYSISKMIKITAKNGRKERIDFELSCWDINKLISFLKDVVKDHKEIFDKKEDVEWWGEDNE